MVKFGSQNFVVQVIGLLLLWCLAIYTIYQIRSMSFDTLKIPKASVDYHLIIYQPYQDTALGFGNANTNLENLPIEFWSNYKEQQFTSNSCAAFPNPFTIQFHQDYWQTLRTSNKTVRILNAYLDTRTQNPDNATVRLLAMIESNKDDNPSIYCQLWFKEQPEPVTVKTHRNTKLWEGDNSEALPYLVNCVLPTDYQNLIPEAVSLVENPCDQAKNVLKIIYNRPEKKSEFGVCVKGLDTPHKDLSEKIIEWVEILKILGADKVNFYDIGLHPNTKRVIRYYEQKGIAHVTELKLAESTYELTKMQRDIIPFTDCFYRNMYEYKHVVILDIDEVLLPLKTQTWRHLLDSVEDSDQIAFYKARSVYFVDASDNRSKPPGFINMLQNIYREKFPSASSSVKVFFNTDKVLALHNDLPVVCLNDCRSANIDTNEAQLQHYHEDCALVAKRTCIDFNKGTVVDRHILNFKEILVERVSATQKSLETFV